MESGFHKQIFPGFWNPNPLTCILQSRRSVNDLFACKRFVCLICSVVQTIWTLKLTESRGESKNDSKGEAFMMAAAINVPLGRAFVKKKNEE